MKPQALFDKCAKQIGRLLVAAYSKDEPLTTIADKAQLAIDELAINLGAARPQYEKWLIWSIEHKRWWRPCSNGYTEHLAEAGRYTYAEALEIVTKANQHLQSGDEVHEAMLPDYYLKGKVVLAAQPKESRQGWRFFVCDNCEHRWKLPSRDHKSPSGENCPRCEEFVHPYHSEPDATLPVDSMGNLL